jgi:hypothetical protein
LEVRLKLKNAGNTRFELKALEEKILKVALKKDKVR